MPKTNSFIVAVEGDTVDGRKIEASWLRDIAATYNRATYGARVNCEHIRGISPDKPFCAYGDVLACSVEEITLTIGGKDQKKLALRAEIEANDDLVAMNARGQKIYTSIEVAPNFANTGKAGLVGLAVTDTPASLGTDALTFAIKHPGVIRNGPALQQAGNVFSLGHETSFELAAGEVATPPADSAAGMFAAATAFFKQLGGKKDEATPPVQNADPKAPANDNDARFTALVSGMEKLTSGMERLGTELRADVAKVQGEVTTLKGQIDTTPKPGSFARQPAAGGSGRAQTDC